MTDCIFCKIVAKKVGASIVYEDDTVLAFLDIKPVNAGHTLVIPKQHFEILLDVPEETLKQMAVIIKKVAAAIVQGTEANAFNVGMNNGSAAGQIVHHAHFHIIPRYDTDGFREWRRRDYTQGESDTVAAKIRDSIT